MTGLAVRTPLNWSRPLVGALTDEVVALTAIESVGLMMPPLPLLLAKPGLA